MPLGERVHETGRLLLESGSYVLQLDGGGRWRLDLPARAADMLGQRVWLAGIRAGYDLLDVQVIGRVGEEGARVRARAGLIGMIEAAAVVLLLVAGLMIVR